MPIWFPRQFIPSLFQRSQTKPCATNFLINCHKPSPANSIARTHYRIVSDPDTADAVLTGSVLTYTSFPTVLDPTTGRATAVEVHVTMRLDLIERATGKKLYTRPNFEMRERYQISIDPAAFFEESDAALARASEQTAQQVVSSILDNF